VKKKFYFFFIEKIVIFQRVFLVIRTAVLSRVWVGGGCTSDKTDVFNMRTKNQVEKRISFFIGQKFWFLINFSAFVHYVHYLHIYFQL
jgi:hypothetical protein